MVERYFGYREFARIAGISPQRLSELIKQGIVRANEGGMVPESEIGYFIRERLGKELASSGHSYLYLSVGKTDEKLEALRKEYEEELAKKSSSAVEISSIADLVDSLRQNVFENEVDDATVNITIIRYKKRLLKELVKRTQDATFRCINKYADTKEIGAIPLVSIYELLMYDKLYSGEDEEGYRKALSSVVSCEGSTTISGKGVSSAPLVTMDTSFKSIVVSLNLIDEGRNPLVLRSDWNPEAVQAINAMSADDVRIPSDPFIKKFFDLPLRTCTTAKRREEGSEARKILEAVNKKTLSAERAAKVVSISHNGFYNIVNITKDSSRDELIALAGDITQGYYKEIQLTGTEEAIGECFPDFLSVALSSSQQSRKSLVRIKIEK